MRIIFKEVNDSGIIGIYYLLLFELYLFFKNLKQTANFSHTIQNFTTPKILGKLFYGVQFTFICLTEYIELDVAVCTIVVEQLGTKEQFCICNC